jgi:hypothetical protein
LPGEGWNEAEPRSQRRERQHNRKHDHRNGGRGEKRGRLRSGLRRVRSTKMTSTWVASDSMNQPVWNNALLA